MIHGMKTRPTILFILCLLCMSKLCYSQNDSALVVKKTERRVIVTPNPFQDSAQISISGIYHLKTLRISILGKDGHAIMEFIPNQIPFQFRKRDLAAGRYYIRGVDKYGRIPTLRMIIKGKEEEEE